MGGTTEDPAAGPPILSSDNLRQNEGKISATLMY